MSIEKNRTPIVGYEDCVEIAKRDGAILLRDFVEPNDQIELEREVLAHDLTPVDRSGHTIAEQFEDIGWDFSETPPAVLALGKRVCEIVQSGVPEWRPNQVRAQLYRPEESGIDWHRDYKRDLRMVAVASFMGVARFNIQLRQGEVSWQLRPGDLVLMRGALLNGKKDDRPRHRVFAPETGKRLSIAYRQVADEAPELEASDE